MTVAVVVVVAAVGRDSGSSPGGALLPVTVVFAVLPVKLRPSKPFNSAALSLLLLLLVVVPTAVRTGDADGTTFVEVCCTGTAAAAGFALLLLLLNWLFEMLTAASRAPTSAAVTAGRCGLR